MDYSFGKYLAELRIEKSLSQRKLAKLSGLTNSTISRLEADIVNPDLMTIRKLSEALEIDSTDILVKVGLCDIREEIISINSKILSYSEEYQKRICEELDRQFCDIISKLE